MPRDKGDPAIPRRAALKEGARDPRGLGATIEAHGLKPHPVAPVALARAVRHRKDDKKKDKGKNANGQQDPAPILPRQVSLSKPFEKTVNRAFLDAKAQLQ